MNTQVNARKDEGHPCFDKKASHENARLHLPVAPKCNVRCNFCNRKFDCLNESRPGVTSRVLNPEEAADYTEFAMHRLQNLSVVGVAGPGDPLANADVVFDTFDRIRALNKDIKLCLSTNGLALPLHTQRIIETDVSHVTVTVNGVDPAIVQHIYSWVRYNDKTLRGEGAARVLLASQEEGIRKLTEAGLTVKINMIAIPGVNIHHLGETAQTCASWGAHIANIIPMMPLQGTRFADKTEPSARDLLPVKSDVGKHLPLMLHCSRCRADAAGLLGRDESLLEQYTADETSGESKADRLAKSSSTASVPEDGQDAAGDTVSSRRVAVGSREGILVNAHLGEAEKLFIFEEKQGSWAFVETRATPLPGGGSRRWEVLSTSIQDCQAIFIGGIGATPRMILMENNIEVFEVEGSIQTVLAEWAESGELKCHAKRTAFACGQACSGNGGGCG